MSSQSQSYICPFTRSQLEETKNGLLRADKIIFPYLTPGIVMPAIPNFLGESKLGELSEISLAMYKDEEALTRYRNYLEWLFQVFEEDETLVRKRMVSTLKVKTGDRVLIVGCGLGEDLPLVRNLIGSQGELYAQDISAAMVLHAQKFMANEQPEEDLKNTYFSVGDACSLPFVDGFFDAVFHFGGINLFDNVGQAILEMSRVVRPGGRVAFGDESIGPWLKETEYGRIVAHNNPLWSASAPLEHLPEKALDVNLTWLLGNCFYFIDFEVSKVGPVLNLDLPNKGIRGGTLRTRYYGRLEGVTPETKERVEKAAKNANLSIHEWLEHALSQSLNAEGN